jgi:hypothetical protein
MELTNGLTKNVIQQYLSNKEKLAKYSFSKPTSNKAFVIEAWIDNSRQLPVNEIAIGEVWYIKCIIEVLMPIDALICAVGVTDFNEVAVNTTWQKPKKVEPGQYEVSFEQVEITLASGKYLIQLGLMDGANVVEFIPDALSFEIVDIVERMDENVLRSHKNSGIILNQMKTTFRKL